MPRASSAARPRLAAIQTQRRRDRRSGIRLRISSILPVTIGTYSPGARILGCAAVNQVTYRIGDAAFFQWLRSSAWCKTWSKISFTV